jgi:hypothetical protein
MGVWDQNGPLGDLLGGGGGVDSPGSGYGSLTGCCECGDEPLRSGATELVVVPAIPEFDSVDGTRDGRKPDSWHLFRFIC